jgi:hypothetical protein
MATGTTFAGESVHMILRSRGLLCTIQPNCPTFFITIFYRRYPLRGEGHGGRGARGIQGSSVGGGRGGRGWAWGKGGGLDAPVESFSGGGRFDSRFMQNKSTLAGQL